MLLCHKSKPRKFIKRLLDWDLYPTVFLIWILILPVYLFPAIKIWESNLQLVPFGNILTEIVFEDIADCKYYVEVIKK